MYSCNIPLPEGYSVARTIVYNADAAAASFGSEGWNSLDNVFHVEWNTPKGTRYTSIIYRNDLDAYPDLWKDMLKSVEG